jgi:hypothetical protein
MAIGSGDRAGSPWEQFGLRYAFGNWGNTAIRRKESKKARKKRLKEANKTPRRKKKKKEELREIFQSHMSANGISYNDAEAYGDSPRKKKPGTVRVAFQNAQLFPEHASHYKSRQIVQNIAEHEYDVWMTNEVGLFWRKLLTTDQWEERAFGKMHDSTAIFAHNTTEPDITDKIQYGGVGIVASAEIKHRISQRGKDPTGLGRWAWIRTEGREGHHVRYVTAYRPCESGGASSVFQQHARALGKNNDFRNPRKALLEDLVTAIRGWMESGDHIILGMDANEDVRGGDVNSFLQQVSLREVILELHSDSSPPATQNRNHQRQPIDGLWASPGISISQGGYLAFGDGCPSDHRGLWFDVEYSVALGQRPPNMVLPQPKRLKSKDPRTAKKYTKLVKKKMKELDFESRVLQLQSRAQDGWDSRLEKDYNSIQQENSQIRSDAEKKIRKLTMGGVPWSPELQVLRDTLELWTMLVRRKKKVKVSVKRIRRFLKKVTVRNAFTCSLQESQTILDAAFRDYKKAKKEEALQMRHKFQESLAQAIALKKGTDADTEASTLKRIETQRRQARNVKRMRGRLGNSRVTKLWYTDPDGNRVQCSTQSTMEDACFHENENRFSQTESTPPMQEPTLSHLGFLADTPEANQILGGCYEAPPGTDKYMVELLSAMRIPQSVLDGIKEHGHIKATISELENKQGWTKRKLASAEPSGLTMDHYAVGAEDPLLNKIDTLLRQLPYQFGFSPEAWQTITDIEILKKAEVYEVELMRTIQLMHAEFNMNNKKLGRDVMSFAELCKALAAEQFGSRKNHQSILAVLNKRLTNDLLRQCRLAGVLCANDAKACYDRIVHSIAILSLRRVGLPLAPARSMFQTLQKSAHHVSTAFGVSTRHYGSKRSTPMQGVGQGNGAGPCIWAVISTVLIMAMASKGHGFNMLSALSSVLISFVCYAFVDDTDLVHTAQSTAVSGEVVIDEMQGILDRWAGLLRATGGALVPKKSYWYAIDFKWNGSKWLYRSIDDMPGELLITGVAGERVVLVRHEPKVGQESLGVLQGMDGNNADEIAHLRKKAESFADDLRTGFLKKNDAWYALNSTILKTMEYPMASTTIKEKEWNYIMAPILRAGLPRSGIERNFPHDILYGPKCLQGFGIFHPWYHQEIVHLLVCLKQTGIGGITGRQISASVEQMRLELGLTGWFTDHDYDIYAPLLTDCWMKTVWKFSHRFKIEIRDSETQLRRRRTKDQSLIQAFAHAGFRGTDLLKLNTCRMFLHSVMLSDIATISGLEITLEAWEGRREFSCGSEFSWPRVQDSLPADYWKTWQRALNKCFLLRSSCRMLAVRLGKWVEAPARWQWFFSPSEDRLYKKEHLLWRAFPRHLARSSPRRGVSKFKHSDSTTSQAPADLIHASVNVQGSLVLRVATEVILPRPNPPPPATRQPLEGIRLARDAGFAWAISELSVDNNAAILASAIVRGTAVAVSDGSFKNHQGTSGFVIEGDAREGRLVGVNVIPGEPDCQTSYRSEIGGVAGILEALHCVCESHDITSGAVEIGLDGDQAMKAVASDWPLDPSCPDYDMLQHVRGMIKASRLDFTFRWIPSHQDKNKSFAQLDRWAQLNVECDGLAKSFWNTCSLAKSWLGSIQFGYEGWSLWIDGHKLATVDKSKLYEYTFSARTKAYWYKKHSLTPELITSINWEACGDAMGRLPFGKKRWLLKHATGFCGVGKREFLRGNQDHEDCPRCGEPESSRHVVECRGTGTDLTFTLAVHKLETRMLELDTAPPIAHAILTRVRQWRKHGDRRLPTFRTRDKWGAQHAVADQDKIGWYNFLIGRVSKKWSDSQQRFIDSLKRKNSGRRWTSAVIQKALDIAWDMWEQRNDVLHNSMHPQRAVAVAEIQAQLRVLYRQGREALLPMDRHLFSKSFDKLTQDQDENLMQQWITSVLQATRRAASARADLEQTMRSERALMQRWLG